MSAVKAPSCAPSETFWLELTGQQSLAGHEYVLSEIADDGNEVVTPLRFARNTMVVRDRFSRAMLSNKKTLADPAAKGRRDNKRSCYPPRVHWSIRP